MSTPAASLTSANCSNYCRLSAFPHGAETAETAETAEMESFTHGAQTAQTAFSAYTGVAASAFGTSEGPLLVVLFSLSHKFFVPLSPRGNSGTRIFIKM